MEINHQKFPPMGQLSGWPVRDFCRRGLCRVWSAAVFCSQGWLTPIPGGSSRPVPRGSLQWAG